MKAILSKLAAEPAMVVAVILALVNMVWGVTEDQALQLQTIIESALVLLGGATVRSQVKPVSKLPPSMKGAQDNSLPPARKG